MKLATVAGPIDNEKEAINTCAYLGNTNHSIYSTGEPEKWFIERHLDIIPEQMFGLTWSQIQAKQQKL